MSTCPSPTSGGVDTDVRTDRPDGSHLRMLTHYKGGDAQARWDGSSPLVGKSKLLSGAEPAVFTTPPWTSQHRLASGAVGVRKPSGGAHRDAEPSELPQA
jgi:hypothetical protein